ncbi:MAG TPA: sulfatase-like hydrolase/transferase [Thermoguttaceae bacterium]|nr:sulfatase-like hydrolase/transferase [Thermoguttaceae bacterium]
MKSAQSILCVLGAVCGLAPPAESLAKPNILLIVADDLGYGDVGCYGATKIKTPNIDRLAGEGVRLTDAHAPAAVCQPTRYAILSGTHFTRAKRQGKYTLYFHEGQVTLPGLLKLAGYRTAAIGKWHLGFGRGAEPDYNGELKPGPLETGFDYFFGCPRTHNEPPMVFVENHRMVGFDPADPIRIISHDEVVNRGLKDWGWGLSEGASKAHAARPVEKIDLILAEKASRFIAQKSDAPFFLYLPFLAPHVPIAPAAEFQGTSQAARYGDYVQQLDACVGKVLDALRTQGLVDNTLVLFTSDNGAVLHRDALEADHRANSTLLGQKTDAWEGGHRVPFIARWPGRIPAGLQGDQLLGLTDLMATLAAAVDVALPEGAAPDSLNQLSVLTDPAHAAAVRNEFLMQGTGGLALRQGNWVYLPKQGSCGMTVQSPPGPLWGRPYGKLGLANSDVDDAGRVKPDAPPVQLYNLATDPGQATNLAASEPQRAAAMQQRLAELIARPKPAAKPRPKPKPAANDPSAPPQGLAVAPDGTLLKDGRPYRGVGADYFDLLIRLLHDPTNTSSLDGLERLGKAEIPFVRFAVAYGEREWRLFLDDRDEVFHCFDLVVRAAEQADVGRIPSIFWHFMSFPDLVRDPRDQWGNPDSRTIALMREVTCAIVERYKDSPAIRAWEFGNEPNLMADLPNAAQFRKPGGTERDDLTSRVMVVTLTEFAKEARRHDTHRPIIAGHSHPRASAWHNTAEKSWIADSREQTLEIIRRDNPAPLDNIAIHIYGNHAAAKELAAWATDHTDCLQAVRDLAPGLMRPVFVGEFGLAERDDPASTLAGSQGPARVCLMVRRVSIFSSSFGRHW